MSTTHATRNRSAGKGRPTRRRTHRGRARQRSGWLLFALPLAVIVGLVIVAGITGTGTSETPETADGFLLPDSAGGMFRLADALKEGDTLLYFSMGVGCDGCFAQIPEITEVLNARGIRLASIMVDPSPAVAHEAARFRITDPILIDADRQVSQAYGMLGVYGHTDRPSHSFALVRQDGTVAAVQHYATMFVPADQLLADLGITTAGS